MVAIPPADYLDFIWPDMYLTIAMVVAMVGCVIFAMYNAKNEFLKMKIDLRMKKTASFATIKHFLIVLKCVKIIII